MTKEQLSFNAAEATEGFKSIPKMANMSNMPRCFNAAEATEGFKSL